MDFTSPIYRITRGHFKSWLPVSMGPDLMQTIVNQLAEYLKKFNDLSQTPIVLTSQVIRIGAGHVRRSGG